MDTTPQPVCVTSAGLWTGDYRKGASYRVRRADGGHNHLLFLTSAGAGRIGHATGWLSTGAREALVIEPGTPHDYGTDPAAGSWRFRWAHVLAPPAWRELLDWPLAAPGIRRIAIPPVAWPQAWSALKTAHRLVNGAHRRAFELGMNALAGALLWIDEDRESATGLDPRVLLVQAHIRQHLAQPMDIDGLARIAGLSAGRFAHLFKAALGQSPRSWIEHERLSRAAKALTETGAPVAAISAAVGFSDPFHFSARFHRWSGYAPRDWRLRVARPSPPRSGSGA